MQVLVIETAFPGDAVLAIALADELKRIDTTSEITYLVRPDASELLRFAPAIDRVIAFDKRGTESGFAGIRKKAIELNTLGFDTIYVLHESERTSKLLSLLTSRIKVGFSTAPKSMVLDRRIETATENRSARSIRLLETQYDAVSLETAPTLVIPSSYSEAFNLPEGAIAIAPGSVWATKCWPVGKFKELATALVGQGRSVVILGGPDEIEKGTQLSTGLPASACRDLTGQTSLVEAAAVIANCSILVANDSAPVHLATAVRTPCVDIFGPTLPSFGFAPSQTFNVIVEIEGLWCRPCSPHGSATCPVHTHDCMELISVEKVLEAVEVLERKSIF